MFAIAEVNCFKFIHLLQFLSYSILTFSSSHLFQASPPFMFAFYTSVFEYLMNITIGRSVK